MEPKLTFLAPEGEPDHVQLAILALHSDGAWLLASDPDGWRFPKIDVFTGETPRQAIARSFANIECSFICTFQCFYGTASVSCALYYAAVSAEDFSGTLTPFKLLPVQLAFPQASRALFQRAQWFLNGLRSRGELWDVYDAARRRTGALCRRGEPLPEGGYHLVVHAWLRTMDGFFLLTRRAPEKGYPLLWECTGGAARAGEDSITAVLREIREETGLTAQPECGTLLHTIQQEGHFLDLWCFQQNFSLDQVRLQPGETCGAQLVALPEVYRMYESGQLVPYDYFESFFPNYFPLKAKGS